MKYLIKNIIYVFSIITTSLVLINCGGSIESVERDELIATFESNFGFSPPKSVKEIKLKNWDLYDTDVHWLAFTYDSIVLSKIISNEQNLSTVLNNSSEFKKITETIKENRHNPKWLELPDNKTIQIYFKKNFIEQKTFSEYYLWVNTESRMAYLYVHSFY